MNNEKSSHVSVLLQRSTDLLKIDHGIYVDLTLGGGGHTLSIAKELIKIEGTIICFDVDNDAILRFQNKLLELAWKQIDTNTFVKKKCTIILVRENFSQLSVTLEALKIEKINGTIIDLGISSDQIADKMRGFSYMKDGPLDMRMDQRLQVTAKDLINGLYEKELTDLFRKSDEPDAKRIAREITKQRKIKPITHTSHLVQIIQKALPTVKRGKRQTNRGYVAYWVKPVMRVFQALRIAVNSELSSLRILLPQVLEALYPGGRFVAISFHSGEDRIIKHFIQKNKDRGKLKNLTKRPIRPREDEIEKNTRARSARLRAFEKI